MIAVDPLADAAVLVIDDTEAQRYTLVNHLRRAGCVVREAATGADGLRLARAGVELVLLDVNLPDVSGLAVARALKADPETAHVQILHVSADRIASRDRAAGLDGGADAYLAHPVDPDELVATARALLRLAHTRRALEERSEAAEHALAALAASEMLFRTVQDAALHGFALHRPVRVDGDPHGAVIDFELTYVNPAGVRIIGRTAESLQGRRMLEVFPSLRDQGVFAAYADVIATGTPFARDVMFKGADGGATLAVTAVRVGTGAEEQLAVTFADITARTEADAERARLHEDARSARRDADEARTLADEANREKTRYLVHMSHELRTPLGAILGYAELLDLGIHGTVTDAQRTVLGRISGVQRHMLGLVDDVLQFATLATGHLEYDVCETDVTDVIDSVMALIEPQCAAKGLTVEVRMPTGPSGPDQDASAIRVWADRARLVQVLLNLMANAIKFTPAGGQIRVERGVRSEGETPCDVAFIRVADTGIGIAAAKLDTIFEPFVQVHQGSAGGSGLGLAISRGLARGMGGELRARSTVGEGSAFTVTLRRVGEPPCGTSERRDGERRIEPDRRTPSAGAVSWLT